MEKENTLIVNKHVLICVEENDELVSSNELEYVKSNFCGFVEPNVCNIKNHNLDNLIYLSGNIELIYNSSDKLKNKSVNIIKETSYNYEQIENLHFNLISLFEVPVCIYGVGVYFRSMFASSKDYFSLLDFEHQFQELTESNKESNAYRKGIYLSNVSESNDGTKFNLLRCSSNLNGPTDNFRTTDQLIINKVNETVKDYFEQNTELNHVLAQIYYNNKVELEPNKIVERKAKIKEHSDKTKDMPRNGLMAFCTFYKNFVDNQFIGSELNQLARSEKDNLDWVYNNSSVLTKMRFRLKNPDLHPELTKQFDLVLYPNSVFVMDLKSNRLYTHEIVPSSLPINKIPTRLGYVIRCSKTEALYKDNQTWIIENGNLIKLEEPDDQGVHKLKSLYYKENMTEEPVDYDKFYFSLNSGDYLKPII